MTAIIIFFGVMIFVAGTIIIANPELIIGLLRKHKEEVWLQVVAIGIRVVMGILLIQYAGVSRYPATMAILGWVSIAAAIGLGVIGRRYFIGLMSRAFSLLEPYGRFAGVLAMLFGAFIIYAFV